MGLYVASAFSEHLFQEGFLAKKLDDLVESGVAVNGLFSIAAETEKVQPYLMHIAYDIKGRPFVLYNSFYTEEVDYEFAKRLLIPTKSICDKNLDVLMKDIDSGRLHDEFKETARRIIKPDYLENQAKFFRN